MGGEGGGLNVLEGGKNEIKDRERRKLDAEASVVRKAMGSGEAVLSKEEGDKSDDDGSVVHEGDSRRKRRRGVNHSKRFKGK